MRPFERDLLSVGARAQHHTAPLRRPAPREPKIHVEKQEDQAKREGEDEALGVQAPQEHAFVPDLTEPQPVGIEADGRRHDEQQERGYDQEPGQAAQPHWRILTDSDNLITQGFGRS